ncbi:MAG: nucleotide sugar dehydrogenase [Roseburia sp.]|nr:nucleotide sugar dehydrogenase [Roseburia sp.]
MTKIAVAGTGYVGLANAVLLAQHNNVVAVDIVPEKVQKINKKISPISDKEIEEYLADKKLNLIATADTKLAYESADFVIISTPTNYDDVQNYFDTSSVESAIEAVLAVNTEATIVIKSTVPVGYTETLVKKYNYNKFLFSPEFLREGKALYDNLYPSRIIVGIPQGCDDIESSASKFISLLKQGAIKTDIPSLIMSATEAEAVKLFANTYLALRVSYFNELDTYCKMKGLDTRSIIEGIGYDPRIGSHYNNPSFGYGGYCLPKDTKQLRANYKDVPENLISAIVQANETRKDFIADEIIECLKSKKAERPVVGIYRLTMKAGSDNFRQSAIQGIIERLLRRKTDVCIYEPTLDSDSFMGCKIADDFDVFINTSTVIVANRLEEQLKSVADKVYTRDIYYRD